MATVITDDQAQANIAANVRALLDLRRTAGKPPFTQAQLAKATRESDMRISKLVRGVAMPEAAFLARIAEALETSVDSLVTSEPRKKIPV